MGLSVENWNWNLCYIEKYPKLGLQFYLSVEPELRYILLKIKLTKIEGYLAINFPFWSSKNWIQSGTQTFGPQ
jgi:hypothetical protein